MKKIYRRILLFTATVVFLSLAPLLVLYAMGYRTSLTAVDPVPVGVILIETTPRRANVFMNDTFVGRTPHSIPNLEPGPVAIRIEAPGYEQWQKTIMVEPARAVELRNIRLFPTEQNRTTLQDNTSQFSLSPNRKLIATVTAENHIHIIDTEGTLITPPYRGAIRPTAMLWSPESDALIVSYPDQSHRLLEISTSGITATPLPQVTGATQLEWDSRVPDRLLALLPDNAIWAVQSDTGAMTELIANVAQFATSARQIIVATEHQEVLAYSLQGEEPEQILTTEAPIRKILATPSGNLAFWLDTQELLFYTPNEELVSISSQVTQAGWSPSGKMVLFETADNALYVYNADDERSRIPYRTRHLVTRLSRPIADPQWYAGGAHLIYQVNDEILITEIDTRDHPITYQVDTTNHGQAQLAVGEDGDTVFYLARTGTGTALMVAQLVVDF